jgi:hypothetical protein
MLSIDLHEWRRLRWRVLQWLLAVTVSLVLLGGAALEAGKRLAPTGTGLDGRLVSVEPSPWKPT